MTRTEQIKLIELTEEEINKAIWSAKIAKYHALKNRPYYEELEKINPRKDKRSKTI